MPSVDWNKYGVPPVFHGLGVADISNLLSVSPEYQPVFDACTAFLRSERRSLFFFGKNGSGKSFTACALIQEVRVNMRASVMRVTTNDLVQQYVDEGWQMPPEYQDCRVLLLEELGKTHQFKNSDVPTPIVEGLIKFRAEANKRTIYTANCGVSDLEKIYGATVASMIRGTALPVKFPSIDLRAQGNKI